MRIALVPAGACANFPRYVRWQTYAPRKISDNHAANTKGKANSKAREQGADARKDAASDKRDADYAVAKEKCDAFAGDAKASCLNEAKACFGE